ncbi:WD40 repeat-like protein, partial [Coccomyxa subellipsoidea C-169]
QEASRFNETFARKLSVENVLQGHEGCVNRLAWNEEGTLLASGSDDRRVLLWHYPDSNLAPVVLKTPHLANIFGVRILPCSGNRRIVTGAMDCSVQLHVLDASPSTYARAKREQRTVRWVPDEGNEPVPLHTTKYLCHSKRVKGVEVAPRDPHVFWSVSEDGDVRQFDTRSSTQDEEESPNVLLSLKRSSAADDVELKCMAINKVRPNEMAVGAHDQYIRIFDRRMLCTGMLMVAQLSKKAEGCKSAGNHAYFEKDFAKAVRLYSDAIHYAPGSALLYSNRSAALLGRGWQGDAWFALQDSEQALRINASSSKAVYRRIQALRALGLLEEAAASMEQFEGEFPDMQKDAKRLRETIEEDLAEVRKKAELRRTHVPEGRRLLQRYMGHCNIQTDIKEVTFLGDNDELVAAGSDDGRIFIYAAKSGLPIVALEADEDVANCVAPHPSLPVLATSGIESAVRLWSPKGPAVNPDLSQEVAANQDRMRAGPSFGARLNPRLLAAITQNPELLQVIMSRTRVAGLSSEQELAGAEQDQDGPGACSIS